MKLGVTGTRSGMNDNQKHVVSEVLRSIITREPDSELHHGDCVGVDVEVAEMAKSVGFKVVCHPPINDDLRAYHASDVILGPFTYFARNRNIVDATEKLLVVPYQDTPQKSGGTWYTHDYAHKKDKYVFIAYPLRDTNEIF